jgi:CheY-like chemotaxis protein
MEVLNTTLDSETAEAGRLSVQKVPMDPVGLIRDLVLLNRPNATAKGLDFDLHIAAELSEDTAGSMMADPHRVRQILSNLIGNAIKFTVRGRVEARLELSSSGRIAIEIADTGPGLSAEELSQAFIPFNRIERTSAGTSGAGLGLSLAQQLAQLMGGELGGHSAVGVGSCFRLELPYDATIQADRHAAVPEPTSQPVEVGRPLRILIAEADALNAAMLRAVIEQLGHQAVHAVDGRRALDLASVCEFDLLMIDGRMPNLDGPDTIAAVRALPEALGRVPVIAVIGGDAEEARECTEAGADAVLRKPVTVAAVARAIADCLNLRRTERSAQRNVA